MGASLFLALCVVNIMVLGSFKGLIIRFTHICRVFGIFNVVCVTQV